MTDQGGSSRAIASIFDGVLALQPQYAYTNTAPMDARGQLVRHAAVDAFRELIDVHEIPIDDFEIEASDGKGNKAKVPWIRFYSREHSPSATAGWYVVFLFAADGSAAYLALGQGTTVMRGGFRPRPETFLTRRVEWARKTLADNAFNATELLLDVDLRDDGSKGKSYESGNVYSRRYESNAIPDDATLLADLQHMLSGLDILYRHEREFVVLPEGYGPSGALVGFTEPEQYIVENLADAPNTPGVHVVWNEDGQLLYAGSTIHLRTRMRDHLNGDRQGSILHEKVARIVDQQKTAAATGDDVRAFLARCSIAWKSTAQYEELKKRIVDELHPLLSERRPTVANKARKALVVYVGEEAARVNFRFGLDTRTWGFPGDRPEYQDLEEGDWILFARGFSGGSPRTDAASWAQQGVSEIVLGRLTTTMYFDDAPHWPDEVPGGRTYPYRCKFEIVRRLQDVSFEDTSAMSAEVVEALRLSVNGGRGRVVKAIGSLFEAEVPIVPIAREAEVDVFDDSFVATPQDFAEVCSQFAGALEDANLRFGANHLDFVRSFVVSLATKRLVLLTGLSGSGKTRIAMGFGQWLGDEFVEVIPVRPDWTGPEPLLGYEDALLPDKNGRRAWSAPDALRFLLRAARNPGRPYLLVLDEMNLAHVERYFADLLSGMESQTPILPNLFEESDGYWRIPAGAGKIAFPNNLFVVGTVNVDETTYMFSPKVLDRANTLEFRVDSGDLRVDASKPLPVKPAAPDLTRTFLAVARDDVFQAQHPPSNRDVVAVKLVELHNLLSSFGLEFGHRTFYEALRYAAILEAAGETNQWRALDAQVKQKVLPRLHGSARKLTEPLSAIARFCHNLNATGEGRFDVDTVEVESTLPESFDKVRRMTHNLRANQFTSFSE